MALFNQQAQRIEVIVRRAGSAMGGMGETEQPAGAGTTENPEEAASAQKSKKTSRWSKNALMHYGNMAKNITMRGVKYYIGGTKYRTGDAALQDIIDRQVEIAADTTNLAVQTAFGAVYGTRVGGVVGGLIGGASTWLVGSLNLMLDRWGDERDYNMKLFKEENGIAYRRARAGINLTTGRLR